MRSVLEGEEQYPRESNEIAYEDEIITRLRSTIQDHVGRASMYNAALLKNVKPAMPEKYSGDDDIEVFEAWLAGLLRWFRVTGITGEE